MFFLFDSIRKIAQEPFGGRHIFREFIETCRLFNQPFTAWFQHLFFTLHNPV